MFLPSFAKYENRHVLLSPRPNEVMVPTVPHFVVFFCGFPPSSLPTQSDTTTTQHSFLKWAWGCLFRLTPPPFLWRRSLLNFYSSSFPLLCFKLPFAPGGKKIVVNTRVIISIFLHVFFSHKLDKFFRRMRSLFAFAGQRISWNFATKPCLSIILF